MIKPISKIILYVSLFFVTSLSYSQNRNTVDSLKTVLKATVSNEERYDLLIQLSNTFLAFQPDSSLVYTQKNLDLAERNGDKKYIPKFLNGLATIYRLKKEYVISFEKDSLALIIGKAEKDTATIVKSQMGLAKSLTLQERLSDALVYCKQAITFSKDKKDLFKYHIDATLLLSTIYKNQKEYGLSLETLLVLKDAIDKSSITPDRKGRYYTKVASTYVSAGNIDKVIENHKNALPLYQEAGNIGKQITTLINIGIYQRAKASTLSADSMDKDENYKNAIDHHLMALDLMNKHNDDRYRIVLYTHIGYSYKYLQEYDRAEFYFLKGVAYANKTKQVQKTASLYCSLGELYTLTGAYEKARKNIERAKRLFNMEKGKGNFENRASAYFALFSLDTIQNRYTKETIINHHMALVLTDSLKVLEANEKIAEIETKYETQKKDKQIKELATENQAQLIQIEKEKNRVLQLITAALLILLLCVLLYYRYVSKKRALNIIKSQKAQLVIKNEENKLLTQEIHHRIKNNLQIILSLLDASSDKILKSPQKALDVLTESQNKIKSIAILHQNLYQAENFISISANDYFRNLLNNLKKTYEATLTHNPKLIIDIEHTQIPMSLAVPIGLITNELVTNIYKYAFEGMDQENEIYLGFERANNESPYILTIRDNGKGMNTEDTTQDSFGLEMVRGLVAQYEGTLEVKNGVGLTYTIKLKQDIAA